MLPLFSNCSTKENTFDLISASKLKILWEANMRLALERGGNLKSILKIDSKKNILKIDSKKSILKIDFLDHT